MGKRGPKAGGPAAAKPLETSSAALLQPSPGLSDFAKTVWVSTVACFTPDYFNEADRSLLEIYCQEAERYLQAQEALKTATLVYEDEKGVQRKTPWLDVLDGAVRRMNSTAGKLRISPSSRYTVDQAAGKMKNLPANLPHDPLAAVMYRPGRAN